MRKHNQYPMGSVSHGTMRSEDLIPDFISELQWLAKIHKQSDHIKLCKEITARMEEDEYYEIYYASDDSEYDLESLFDALNEYAAPYFYFGAHPGDGSDYGFWLSDMMEYDFDGLKVEDLSEVPKDYSGEILLVNDHGNMSLYYKAKTQQPREIWAVV